MNVALNFLYAKYINNKLRKKNIIIVWFSK